MWETICDAQAGFWLNSKFLSKFSRKPLSGISDQKAPPPPFRKTSDLRCPKFTPEYPPPPFWKTSDLRWPKFTLEYPPPSHPPPHPVVVLQSGRSYVETNLYPPWIPLVFLLLVDQQWVAILLGSGIWPTLRVAKPSRGSLEMTHNRCSIRLMFDNDWQPDIHRCLLIIKRASYWWRTVQYSISSRHDFYGVNLPFPILDLV